jgi:hypothetical protein
MLPLKELKRCLTKVDYLGFDTDSLVMVCNFIKVDKIIVGEVEKCIE